ncbi:hypothetical protein LOD99_1127 [Oopsacas minuta]|uniref:Sulfotransferase domain-containing protein n=1 Tax=Oopsacas minuta TaxID=111878 RepID=A0AAV7K537_9METZ|nr:hypothetical protein LOD99_1127 [Oopsacas minuta]
MATIFLAFLTFHNSPSPLQLPLVTSWPRRPPDVVIIGVKKGGTRALLEMLKLHPRVVSPQGEVHFYDKYFERGTDWYLSRMPSASPDLLIIEKTPSYFVTPDAPLRMIGVNPDTRVVLVVRDPVTRLVSDFVQLSKGEGDFETFVLSPDGEVSIDSRPVWTGLYASHLLKWTDVFPSKQMHVVNGDRLALDPVAEIVPLQQFLELKPLINEDTFYFNSTKGFFCWHSKYDKCLGEGKGRPHPEVRNETLVKLKEYYSEPNRAFFRILTSLDIYKSHTFNWSY